MKKYPLFLAAKRFSKHSFTLMFIIAFQNISSAQIEKGNWLIGGNAGFSSYKYKGASLAFGTQSFLEISPAVGLFLTDNLVAGLRPGYTYSHFNSGTTLTTVNSFRISPFARYYFLEKANRTNIFVEARYIFSSEKVVNNPAVNAGGFGVMGGPVVFLNPNVGIEFTVGYTRTSFTGSNDGVTSLVQVGIGLQVYLEKTKSL